MAVTDFGALSKAQKRVWSAELWQAGRDKSFFFANGFIGKNDTDSGSVIQRINDLTETERGMECVMQLVQDLQGDGVAGDNELDGNEEAMISDAQSIRLDQLRHGVKSKGEMAEQATIIRFRTQGKEKLAHWMADKLDELMFLVLSGRPFTLRTDGRTRRASELPSLKFAADVRAPSPGRRVYAGQATSEGDITANDRLSWETVVRANAIASEKRLRPIRNGGKEHFVMVIHPRQKRDLVLDPTYITVLRSAEKPGSNHPLFTGAMATIDGTIIHSHNKVFHTGGLPAGQRWGIGGNVHGAQALYLGAQAAGIALLGGVFWRESTLTDYGNRPGIGVGRKIGMLKPQFNSLYDEGRREDFGVVSISSAAAA